MQTQFVMMDPRDLERLIESAVTRAVADVQGRLSERVQDLEKRLYVMKDWLSVDEAAAYLGVGASTVRTYIRENGLPCSRRGKFPRLSRADIDAWIEEGRSEG